MHLGSDESPQPAVTDRPAAAAAQSCARAGIAGASRRRAALRCWSTLRIVRPAEKVLRGLQKAILIVGWDFDAGIRLLPEIRRHRCRRFPRSLVGEEPEVESLVLSWSVAVVHAPGSPLPLLLGAEWEKHPRIQVRLDREHPLYGAHHQKIVAIDDTVAFVGGMDLTIRRWDTAEHQAEHALRKGPDGVPYPPVHDVQMVVEGEAALVVADVARERWRRAIRDDIPPVTAAGDLWPQDLAPDFTDPPVAISRSLASWRGLPEITEGMTLTLDALGAARRSIYMEAQYFTAPAVGALLAAALARPEGPEIVAILRRRFTGRMEAFVMGGNQDRLRSCLRRAGRCRASALSSGGAAGRRRSPITMHFKIIIVDDDFVRRPPTWPTAHALDYQLDLAIE